MKYSVFPSRNPHRLVKVTDTNGDKRTVCKCQLDDRFVDYEKETVSFPIFECPYLTRKKGFGTEEGFK